MHRDSRDRLPIPDAVRTELGVAPVVAPLPLLILATTWLE